ncbi:MAG: CBS domain-containing protein [Chloroflexaceae bacterium]|nr:CBS domain-containing protein [Chloroflexaceae bacterium]
MDRTVGEVMHRGVLTCLQETPIQEVAQKMTEHDVSALVVVNDQGNMIGLISRTDLVNARLYEQYWKNWQDLKAMNIMVSDVVCVKTSDTIRTASKLMMDRKIHRVVVIEEADTGKKPIGVLSITDLVREIAGHQSLVPAKSDP